MPTTKYLNPRNILASRVVRSTRTRAPVHSELDVDREPMGQSYLASRNSRAPFGVPLLTEIDTRLFVL